MSDVSLPPATLTPTYYDRLAAEIMDDLDRVVAEFAKLEARHRATANARRAHLNVPRPFLGTAVFVTEEMPEIEPSASWRGRRSGCALCFDESSSPPQCTTFVRGTEKGRLTAAFLEQFELLRNLRRDGDVFLVFDRRPTRLLDLHPHFQCTGRGERPELEQAANHWQLARQRTENTLLAGDVQNRFYQACRGWNDFSNEELSEFCLELTGVHPKVTGEITLPNI